MARRFVLASKPAISGSRLYGSHLPEDADPIGNKIEFVFPAAYGTGEAPSDLEPADEGWGRETIAEGEVIDWQIKFTEKPIGEEELRGVAGIAA